MKYHFMADEDTFVLINEPLTDNREGNIRAIPQGVGPGIIAAAEGVLTAAREAGRTDAERVLHAVIELLRAAGPTQSA